MTKYYENPYYDAAFERCVDLMEQMLIKNEALVSADADHQEGE